MITFDEFKPRSRLVEPFHDTDIFLQPAYQVNSVDDLYLWAILNGRGGQMHVTIFPPNGFTSRHGDPDVCAIIPFVPAKAFYIRRTYIDCRNTSDDDIGALSAAFQLSLAMVSYSRGYWKSLHATGGRKGKIQKKEEKACLDVEVASGLEGIEECMTIVGIVVR